MRNYLYICALFIGIAQTQLFFAASVPAKGIKQKTKDEWQGSGDFNDYDLFKKTE